MDAAKAARAALRLDETRQCLHQGIPNILPLGGRVRGHIHVNSIAKHVSTGCRSSSGVVPRRIPICAVDVTLLTIVLAPFVTPYPVDAPTMSGCLMSAQL
jgi:hypothetical protein